MKFSRLYFLLSGILAAPLFAVAGIQTHPEPVIRSVSATPREGILFSCEPRRIGKIEHGMDAYLSHLGISSDLVVKIADKQNGELVYTLNTPPDDTNTLNFKHRPELKIRDEAVTLPAKHGHGRIIHTVSKKEIVLALLQHGRLTSFKGDACNLDALKDHVAIRQNTVAWAEHLTWVWPDGESAEWNEKYWDKGTPKPGVPLHVALNNVFMDQHKYSVGCYTATKFVEIQGVLDYYRRIKKSPAQLKLVEDRLLLDKDPLVGIEPARMWDFEKDFDPQDLNRPGKLLKIKEGVKAMNFVPGDWIYFQNTDPVSYEKTGYEGSNAIYMGRNKFDDYYDDNDHSYSYFQKLDEVYQWRNGVFSRSRDHDKIQPLTPQDIERLSRRPAEGGLLKSFRVSPYLFAFEKLPVLAEH
ncbi:MAG TPA: hypothetical protein VMV48_09400 [Gallionellaceae bacterium]|nr:hypothetical protein [Gallionellaceae bacterium]